MIVGVAKDMAAKEALMNAPPGPARVAFVAHAILASKPVQHPLFTELAEVCIQAEIDLCPEQQAELRAHGAKKRNFSVRSWNVTDNKGRKNGNFDWSSEV